MIDQINVSRVASGAGYSITSAVARHGRGPWMCLVQPRRPPAHIYLKTSHPIDCRSPLPKDKGIGGDNRMVLFPGSWKTLALSCCAPILMCPPPGLAMWWAWYADKYMGRSVPRSSRLFLVKLQIFAFSFGRRGLFVHKLDFLGLGDWRLLLHNNLLGTELCGNVILWSYLLWYNLPECLFRQLHLHPKTTYALCYMQR